MHTGGILLTFASVCIGASVILALLLRALVAPLILIATVVLSFAAALGVSAVTVMRDWRLAKAWLRRELKAG